MMCLGYKIHNNFSENATKCPFLSPMFRVSFQPTLGDMTAGIVTIHHTSLNKVKYKEHNIEIKYNVEHTLNQNCS